MAPYNSCHGGSLGSDVATVGDVDHVGDLGALLFERTRRSCARRLISMFPVLVAYYGAGDLCTRAFCGYRATRSVGVWWTPALMHCCIAISLIIGLALGHLSVMAWLHHLALMHAHFARLGLLDGGLFNTSLTSSQVYDFSGDVASGVRHIPRPSTLRRVVESRRSLGIHPARKRLSARLSSRGGGHPQCVLRWASTVVCEH